MMKPAGLDRWSRLRAVLALVALAAVLVGCGGGEGPIRVNAGNAQGAGTEVVPAPPEEG